MTNNQFSSANTTTQLPSIDDVPAYLHHCSSNSLEPNVIDGFNLKIGQSNAGTNNTLVIPWEISWEKFIERLKKPDIGEKDGSYFVRCCFMNNYRNSENASTGYFVVLDGDRSVDVIKGEIKR